MKHKAKQIEVKWDSPEPFKLAVEQTTDGDRIAKEQAQIAADKQEAEKQQPALI